jgi:hypothetical protein
LQRGDRARRVSGGGWPGTLLGMALSPRRLGYLALALMIAIAVVELTLPCHVWRWVVGPAGVLFSLFAIAVVGTESSRPDIAEKTRALVVYLSMCGLLGATAAGFGFLC